MNRHYYGFILAGGRGTRFWPRSRKRSAKQVLNVPYSIDGWIWLLGLVAGATGVAIAGLLGTAKVLRTPPMQVFRASA